MSKLYVSNEINHSTSIEIIQEQIQQLVDQIIRPNADKLDRHHEFPKENLAALAAAGFNNILLPKSLGGPGVRDVYTAFSTIVEEIGRGCPSTALVYTMHVEATRIIFNHGNEDQWNRWLKPGRTGRIGTTSTSESATGGHYWYNFSEAERSGDGYLLNAEKSFTTSSGHADFYVVQTKSPNAQKPEDLSYFIINGHQEGIEPGEWDALGVKGNHSSPLKFNNVFVHEKDRIGEEGEGKYIVQNGTGYLIGLGSAWAGTAKGILDEVVAYATRKFHQDVNKSLTDYQVIRAQLAQAKIAVDSLQAWRRELASQLDQKQFENHQIVSEELSNQLLEFKVHASEVANLVAQIAMDVAGGYAYKKGTLERLYRDARAGIVMGPSNNLAREIIGKRLVGIPLNQWSKGTGTSTTL
ncbi:acyl-CoA dehydrogenase family protein [Bacillus sp. Marseille-P3661]|uniref:acyl-CoA dehydrogenase family protein n=1 Tax=Bacillus sp. Marseille-P3661 TaxID=1936234 RepID=UPI000C83A658|nr:acyl-CoA dehydrogenase family protein [Bacillus sp. Marseille-P3661]